MNRLFTMAVTLALTCTVMVLTGCGNPQVLDFKYKANKDSVVKYENKIVQKVSINNSVAGEKPQTMSNSRTTTLTVTEKVKDLQSNGDRTIDMISNDLVIEGVVDGKVQKTPVPQADNQKRTLKIDSRGKILERDGVEVTDDSASEYLTVVLFPDKPKKVGESWTEKHEQSQPAPIMQGTMKINVNIEYTFKGYEKYNNIECARLDRKVNITQTLEKDPKAKNPLNVSGSYTAEGTGYVLYDYKNGIIAKITQNIDMKGNQSITDPKTKKVIKQTTNINVETTYSMIDFQKDGAQQSKDEKAATESSTVAPTVTKEAPAATQKAPAATQEAPVPEKK